MAKEKVPPHRVTKEQWAKRPQAAASTGQAAAPRARVSRLGERTGEAPVNMGPGTPRGLRLPPRRPAQAASSPVSGEAAPPDEPAQ